MRHAGSRLQSGSAPLRRLGEDAAVAWAYKPSKKDEDCYDIDDDPPPAVCDAFGAVYDGHNGRRVAEMCAEKMLPLIEKKLGPTAAATGEDWAEGLDAAITESFHELDRLAKLSFKDGSTATVVMLKRCASGRTLVKCAWVGDSRAILALGSEERGKVVPLSWDHKASVESEVDRVANFYASAEFDEEPFAEFGPIHSPSTEEQGVPFDEMVVESAEGPAPRHKVPPLQDGWVSGTSTAGSHSRMSTFAPALSRRGSGDGGSGDDIFVSESRGGSTNGGGSSMKRCASKQYIAAISKAEGSGSGHGQHLYSEILEGSLRAGNNGGSLRAGNNGGSLRAGNNGGSLANGTTFEGSTHRSTSFEAFAADNDQPAPVPVCPATPVLPQEIRDPVPEKVTQASAMVSPRTVSFVGYFEDAANGYQSKERVFNSAGESLAVTRSIGDATAARGVIATPCIIDEVVVAGGSARILLCSDGVWDVMNSKRAGRMLLRQKYPAKAAMDMVTKSCEARIYGGFGPDDVTAVVFEVGQPVKADANCSAGCSLQ